LQSGTRPHSGHAWVRAAIGERVFTVGDLRTAAVQAKNIALAEALDGVGMSSKSIGKLFAAAEGVDVDDYRVCCASASTARATAARRGRSRASENANHCDGIDIATIAVNRVSIGICASLDDVARHHVTNFGDSIRGRMIKACLFSS